MAISKNNLVTHNLSGSINKQIVFKNYSGKIVVSAYPDMSKRKPSAKQKEAWKKFGEIQNEVKRLLNDPATRAEWQGKCPEGRKLQTFMISELSRLRKE